MAEGDWNRSRFYIFRYLYKNIVPTTKRNIPKNFVIFCLSILCTAFAPTFAITVVIGIKINSAGILIKPMLNGISASKYEPEIKNPMAPNKAIKKPIAAALPIALLIG